VSTNFEITFVCSAMTDARNAFSSLRPMTCTVSLTAGAKMPSCTMVFSGADGALLPSSLGALSALKVRPTGASPVIQQPVSSQRYCSATQQPSSLQ